MKILSGRSVDMPFHARRPRAKEPVPKARWCRAAPESPEPNVGSQEEPIRRAPQRFPSILDPSKRHGH